MNSDNGAGISSKPFTRHRGIDILSFGEFNNVVTILFVEFLIFFKLYVVLNHEKSTIVAISPFFCLNHSGSAFL